MLFRQVFQNDPKLQEIRFDSEAGGFFCDADSLEVLTDLGCRFHEICKNPEQFAARIPAAMAVAEKSGFGKKRTFPNTQRFVTSSKRTQYLNQFLVPSGEEPFPTMQM